MAARSMKGNNNMKNGKLVIYSMILVLCTLIRLWLLPSAITLIPAVGGTLNYAFEPLIFVGAFYLSSTWSKKKEDLVTSGFWYLLAYALIAAVLVGLFFLITAIMGLFK